MVAMPRLGLALQNAVTPPTPNYAQTNEPEKPKFFGEGGMGRIIAGLVGDALLQQGGMAPVYSPAMRQRQEMQAAEAQWTRRREAENADWIMRQKWARDNPAPANPYRFEDNAGNVWERGADGQNRRIFTDMAPKQYIQDGMVINVPNPYNTQSPPQTINEDLWNTGTPVGGSASAPGGFR